MVSAFADICCAAQLVPKVFFAEHPVVFLLVQLHVSIHNPCQVFITLSHLHAVHVCHVLPGTTSSIARAAGKLAQGLCEHVASILWHLCILP